MKRRRSSVGAVATPKAATPSKASTKRGKFTRSKSDEPLTGWIWNADGDENSQNPVEGPDGRTYYHNITYIPEDGDGVPLSISVEDLVATHVDQNEEETRELNLKYWVGQVAALFEDRDGEKKFVLRFFDQGSQWRYQNSDDSRLMKAFGNSFRKFEILETDVCEINPVGCIIKKLNWWSSEDEAVVDNQGLRLSDIPNGLFSDRMIVRCGSDGLRRPDLSDSLWPAPLQRRRNRLVIQCPTSKLSLASASGHRVVGASATPVDETYGKAVEALKLSVLPENLPCREEETAKIRDFIGTAVKSTGTCGNVLYISGVPGTGKTASVLSVINSLQKKSSPDSKFEFVYINSMKLNAPTDLYQDLLHKMWLHKRKGFKADKPQEKLIEYFTMPAKDKPVTVLLVDEIDYLVTKSQAVVYQLFDWPLLPQSRLVLLTISNTMDLPERLMPRVASRLGLARLNYHPYNHEQIRRVVKERLIEVGAGHVFAEDAIQLVARRVAGTSGDIRRALHICRRAIEVRKGPIITAQDIGVAQMDLYASPFIATIAQQPYFARIALVALVLETEMKNTDSVPLRDLWLRFSNLLNTYSPDHKFRQFYYADFVRVAQELSRCAIIGLTKHATSASDTRTADEGGIVGRDGEEIVLQSSRSTMQGKKLVAAKTCKVMAKDNGAELDEDGAGYIVSLNSCVENSDVKTALISEAGDKVAQRHLQ